VGNIFGAPLAMEGLLAFFAESTFIGLWIFGRNRLPPLVHTLSICIAGLGSVVSAFFILTANAWMQHPFQIRIPHLLSLIATLSWNGRVDGITQVQQAEAVAHSPGSYVPVLWVTYWSFRLMVGLGFLMLIASAWAPSTPDQP
jgi:cytochrome bd-type quinol oxidase subunit 1